MNWIDVMRIVATSTLLLVALEMNAGNIHKGAKKAVALVFCLFMLAVFVDITFQPPPILGYVFGLVASPVVAAIIVAKGWWSLSYPKATRDA